MKKNNYSTTKVMGNRQIMNDHLSKNGRLQGGGGGGGGEESGGS